MFRWFVAVTACIVLSFRASDLVAEPWQPAVIDHLQGEMVGEVTETTAILQSRLTGPQKSADGDVPGRKGIARFEISETSTFEPSQLTPWTEAVAEHDFLIKTRVTGLKPGTRYYYRLIYGTDPDQTETGPVRSFGTNPGAEGDVSSKFVVVTGMNYAFFYDGNKHRAEQSYQGADKQLGYPALATILGHRPDFFVGTGDNIYYDHHVELSAETPAEMRKKWHEQFVQPRFVEMFAQVPTYWEKDDHDHRYNDCDLLGDRKPDSDLGIAIFKEQVPVTNPNDPDAVTYRTHRISKHLQIWLLEGRDYRSPNKMEDGPDKTIWGVEQREWLKRTLLESDATYRIVISPTPLIGPDGKGKRDNHTNLNGFRHEGNAFFAWAKEQGLPDKRVYLICGDRHWQYHAIHPSGMEEFSTGALVDANSRLGVDPGDKKGTDPEGLIRQPYTSRTPSGGFLEVTTKPAGVDGKPSLRFDFFDEQGRLLHHVIR